jgi:hypothetical protein
MRARPALHPSRRGERVRRAGYADFRRLVGGDVGEILTFEQGSLCQIKPESDPSSLCQASPRQAIQRFRRTSLRFSKLRRGRLTQAGKRQVL